MRRTGLFFGLVTVLAISILSCDVEIGLGASVDTRAPKLEIENPPIGSVIRDVFAMSGTCEDDGKIKSVIIELKHTGTGVTLPAFEGTFNQKEGIWSCEIDPLDEETPVPDGSYEATVTITDTAERETIRTRAFTIDNTPPVLAITRPSAVIPTGEDPEKYSSNDYDSYGQDLVISGYVADTCERRFISVDIYDMKGEKKYSTLEAEDENSKYIKIDSDFSTSIASFGDSAYTAIYGDDYEAGTKMFFCEITVYDSARKYPLDSSTLIPEDLLGNSAKYFYMYEGELYNSVFDPYMMTDVYKILNGSFEDDVSRTVDTTTPEEVKLALGNVEYQETRGFLSLNPKNNPYFKVSGIDPLDAEEMENGTIFDNTENHITNNSSKDVEFSPGLDQTPLKQETLGIYLLKADDFGNILDSNGNIVELKDVKEEDKIWLLRPLKDKDGNAILTEEKNAEEIAERESLYSKSGSTQKFTITITTTKPTVDGHYLFSGDKYLFGVQGYDKKNVPVKNTGTVFGFKLVESGTAPALTIKSVSPKYITTNTDSVIEDAAKTVKVTMAFAGDSPFRLKRSVNDGEEVEIIKSEDNFKEFEKIDEYTPTEEEIASGQVSSGKVSIRYVLTGNNNLTNYAEDVFYVDNEPPSVISLEVPDTKKTENSSFKFSGEVSDGNSTESSKIAEVQMKITSLDDEDNPINDADGNPVASEWVTVGDTDKWNHIVVFQSADDEFNKVFTVEGKKKVEVRAIDAAGNMSEIFTKTFLYDTDSPNLSVQTYKMGDDAAQPIKSNFFISKGFSISGTVEDGYGIESLILQQTQTKEGEDYSTQIAITVDNNGNWTIGNLPRKEDADEVLLETGVYSFVITATDSAGKEEKSAIYKAEIDRDKPVVTITSPADGSTVSGSTFRFTGTLNDEGTGVTSYSYKFVKAGVNKDSVSWILENTTSDEWSFYKELAEGTTSQASSLCEGEWSLFVRTVDGAGNESAEVEHKFTIDKNIPSLEAAIVSTPDCFNNTTNSVWYYSDELSGTISYSDTYAMDSSKPYSFIMGDVDITSAVDVSDGNWTINNTLFNQIEGFNPSSLDNSQKVLYITVYDKVGKTNNKSFTVYKDTAAPTATIEYPEQGDPISNSQFTARGSISDGSGVGIDSFVYSLNGNAYQPINSGIVGSTWSKEFNFENEPEGEVRLEIVATDKLGYESVPSSVTFFYDKQNPEVSINEDNKYYVKDTSYTLSGTAYDTNRLSKVTIQDNTTTYSSEGTNPQITLTGVESAVSEDSAANWSKIFTTGSNGTLKDGLHTFRVTAYDSSNRVSTTRTKELFIDTTAPVITSIVTPSPMDTEESYYQFSGMAVDNTPSNAVSTNAASGIEKILVQFADKNNPSTKTTWLEATGTTRWNLLVTYANSTYSSVFGSNQGEKIIYVKAIDMAGNESAVEERTFVYDKAQPTVSISSYTIGSNNTPQLLGATTQFDVSNSFSLSGTASDTYKLKNIQVFQKKDDGEDQLVVEIPVTTTSYNWTVSGLPRAEDSLGSVTGTADTETDATYRYYVKVFDASSTEGKTSQTSPITVRIDKTAPTVTITSPAIDFATADDAISGSSKIFEGTAVDNENGSGLASYSYAFSQNNTVPAANSNEWTTINAENGNWSIRRDLLATDTTNTSPESLTQGEWYLFVKAVDKAGNAITSPVTRHFWVDQSAPSLSNVNIEGGVYYYNTESLTLTGNAFDLNALAEDDAVVVKSGNTVLATIPRTGVASNRDWSVVLDADDIPVNEPTPITIEVKDCVGRTSGVSSYTVCRDMTPPVVTASLATNAERVYQKSVNYTFSGTVSDENLADVTAVLYKNGIATQQETALSPRGTDGAWEWKVYDLEEAYYSIKITAKDKADNQTEYTSGSVMIDTTAPLSTISGTSLYDSDGASLATPATGAAVLTNGTTVDAGRYYAQTSYTLSGIITEANFANTTSTLELKENGTTKNVAFTGAGTTASPYTWSYTPASLADGTYAYTLKLTDKAGNTTTYSTTVVYDTTAPVLGIEVPVANAAYPYIPTASGSVSDAGIGIAERKWSSDNTNWSDVEMTTTTNWSASIGTMDSEGPVTLYVKAKDKFGRETSESVNFSYDLYNPQLTETDTVAEYQKAGYSFTLTGTAGDTNALDCITITEGGTNVYGSTNASDSTGTARITTQNAAVTLSENNGDTELSAESGKGKSWSITFSTTQNSFSDGRHTFTITAKDAAGKTSTSEVKNIFIDTIAPQVLTAVTPTTSQTANASFRFTGTAKDNNNSSSDSRVEMVKVKFNSYSSASATETEPSATTEWFDANGDTSWNYIAVFTDEGLNSVFGNNKGYKTISVKAIDYAGNESPVFESPKFLYDREIPTSVINSYTPENGSAVNLTSTPSFFANNTFKLSLTANDDYSVKKIVVKQKNNGITKTVYELDNINLSQKAVDVLNLPRDVSGLDDDDDDATATSALVLNENSSGEYEYSVEVTDVAGKSASVATVKANIDKKVPVINLDTELNAAYYQGLSKTFSFSASDPTAADGSSGSGLSKYYYKFTQDTAAQTVSSSGWTEKVASSSFDVIPSLVSGNTLGTNGELNEGHWYLWYYVKDVAGNTSTPTSADFWFDQGNPSLTAAVTPANNSVTGSGTEFYFNSGLTGTISASDSSNVAPALSYKINNGTAVSVTGTSWTIPASSFTDEGAYSLVFTATDQVGRTATKEFTVHKDVSGPEISITSPTNNSYFEQATINIRGSVNDGTTENPGSGVNKVYYSTNNSSWTELTTYSAGGAIWNDTVSLDQQGNVTLYVKAVDKLGQESTHPSVTFSYDAEAPSIVETDSVAANQKQGYSFTLTGTAYDTNELSYVEIVDKIGDTLQGTYSTSNGTLSVTSGSVATAKSEATKVTWSKTFSASDANPLEQGTHTFTIKAKDTSERLAATITKTVTVDTILPEIEITTPSAAGFTKSAFVTFNGTLTEVNFDSLEIKLYKEAGATDELIETVNTTPQGADGNWSYTANLPDEDEAYYITVKATDKVGNSATETSAQITTDFTAPATTLTSSGLTNESAEPVTSISENVTYYAKDNYTVSGTITEENYDRTKVTITAKNGTTDITGTALTTLQSSLAASLTSDTDKTWSFAGITGTGTYEYSLKIEDKAANSKTYKIKVVYDNTAPESLSITTAATSGADSISGSSKTFEGSASDSGSGLSSYSYAFTQGNSAPAADSNDWIKVETGNGSWSFTRTVISSTQASPNCLHEGLWTLYVKATDKAGNTTTTPVSRQYWVDQSAPAITDLNNAAINYFNGTLTITGKAIDTNALATSGAVVIKNGTTTLATIDSVGTGGTWTASIDGSSITANTEVALTIQAKDCVGKTSDAATYTVYKDTNPPVIAFTSPDGNLAQDEPLSGTSGIFSGTTTDAASGVASYSYVFSKSSTAPATGWTPVTNAVTSWSIPKTFTAGTGTAANDEGQWYLFVKAEDKAGNETAAASSLSFWYDNSVPTITASMTTATGKCENKDGKYYFNGTIAANTALTGSITASDTSAVAPTISYKIDSGTEVEITGTNASTGTSSGTWSIPSSAFTQDGEYTVKIIATDQCGRKAEQTYNVYRDTSAPTITITAPAAATGTIVNTASYTFGGTIADPTFYSASAVLYKDTAATDTTTTIEVNDNNTWTWRPTGLEDGTYHIVVTAKDKVSNTATQSTGTVIVDRTAPATSIVPAEGNNITDASFAAVDALENGKTYYTSSSYTITGVINDNNWGTGATAKYKIDNGAETTLTVNASTKAWSLPAATAGHTYEIKLKDSAGNENTYSFTISYDATAPNASIAIPDADITNPLYALSANNYSFKLSASDNNGGVGVKELSYIFTQTDSLPAANAAWETDSNFTTADKYVVMDLVALHPADSNNANTLSATQLPEGIWYLWVKAKDKAGNITSDETITANRRKIIVDKSNPTLTVTNSLNETGTNPIYEDVTNSGYTISGTVNDTHDVASNDAIVIKVDGETKKTIAKNNLTGTNSDAWSYTIPKASIHTNGLTEVEVIAKDVVGKPTSKKYNLYYDTAAPELEVTAPVSDEQVENAEKIIKGTVRDDGYGLARLEFALKNSSNTTVKDSSDNDISGYWEATANGSTSAGNYPLKIKGEQWFYAGQPDGEGNVAGNTALTIPLGTAEGTLKLVVTATEKVVGNHTARTETEEITFYYDAAEPNITESGSVNRITNTDFVLTGTAYDTNQLAKIEIKQGGVLKATTADGSITFKASSAEDAAAVTLASATSDSAKGTWKATFDADDYEDGSYQFNITATDISGKMTTVTRTIQMDKTAPANISPSVTTSGTELSSKNWYNSRAIAISVTATDTNGSGVSSADYTLDGPSVQNRSWTNIPNNGSAFVGTVNLPADGENTFYVRVKDVAGNIGYNDDGVKVYIDSAAPASATIASVDSVAAGDEENQFGGTKLTNGSNDIAFTMTASDAGTVGTDATGIDSIKIIKVGNNTLEGNAQINVTETAGVLGATIPNTSVTTSGGVIARVTDKVGNSYDFTLFQIQFDNKYPKVTISNIADADTSVTGTQINGTTTISGTASDDQTLASVKLQYMIFDTDANAWPTGNSAWTDSQLTMEGTIYSWSFNVNTTQSPYTDGDSVRFRVLATDAAGNEGNSGTIETATSNIYGSGESATGYAEVIISQDSDRPIIRISNLEMSDGDNGNQVSGATGYYWHRFNSMYGTVQDDDGSVTSVKYKIGADGTWSTESIYSNGMWQISNLTDGTKDIYFEITDAGNKTFTSSATNKPKLQDSQGTPKLGYSASDDVVLKVKVDTHDPEITSQKYYLSNSKDYNTETNWDAASNLGELSTKNSGGANKYLYVEVKASDSNGIDTANSSISFDGVTATSTADVAATENTEAVINKVRRISQNTENTLTTTIVRVDLSQFASGQRTFAVNVKDNAGKSNSDSKTVVVDNTAPVMQVSNYESGVVLYGSNNNTIRLYQNSDSDIGELWYYVTNVENFAPAYNSETNSYTGFAKLDGNKVGATTSIYFDGGVSGDTEYHTSKFYNIIQTITGKTDEQMRASDAEVPLWLWWYTVDKLGNTSVPSASSKFAFKVLPNGDKPKIEITNPEEKQKNADAPISAGGTIRVTGYTEIATDSVDAVYLQIEPDYAYEDNTANLLGAAFDDNGWKAELEAAIYGKGVSYTILDLNTIYPGKFESPATSKYRYAVKASGTTNWSFQLNSKQEVNTDENYVAIRAFAVSKTNNKVSDTVTHVVQINANAPLIGDTVPLHLVQYANADGTGAVVARQEYKPDMYLKGVWYLEGSIEHASGIKEATWQYPSYENNSWTTKNESIVDNGTPKSKVTLLEDKGTYDNYTFKLPIGYAGTNSCGTLEYTLSITDGRDPGAQTIPEVITINYDNKAPELNLTRSSDNDSITLIENETGTQVSNSITQSNGTFTIEGNVNESGSQSGFERVAMYFTRVDDGVTKLVDPMLAPGDGGKANFEAVAGLNEADGLYWREVEGTVANNVVTFTKIGGTAIANVGNFDKIIRNGGLCKINNVIYRFKDVDVTNKTVTVEGTIADITTAKTMYFAAGALIIDHKSTEGGTSYYDAYGNTQYHTTDTYKPAGTNFINDDDGDQMIESATRNGTAYNWSASINSSNILDGLVTVHFVAFDVAGNVSTKSFKANVANNSPRIAGYSYGTDSNGNGVVDANEMITDYSGIYTTAHSSRNKYNGYDIQRRVNEETIGSATDYITVKGALTVKPEIVGGNMGLGYSYSYTTSSGTEYNKTATEYASYTYTDSEGTHTENAHGADNVVRKADLSITIPLSEFLTTGRIPKSDVQKIRFTIWDKTDGTTLGVDSGHADIYLWSKVALTDGVNPTNTIKRFYWRKNNNTIESSVHYDSNGVAQGHIELESDWMATSTYTTNEAAAEDNKNPEYDADPKVSGVVYFEGIATDNNCVEKLSIYVPGLNSGDAILFAQRDRTVGNETLGQFVNCSTVTGVEFVSAEDVYDKKNGTNTVTWKVKVDTSKATPVAATNVRIRAGATDRGSPSLSGNTINYTEAKTFTPAETLNSTGTGATNAQGEVTSPLTALYKIDIVPYITKLYTGISDSAGDDFARSATGKYIVRANETVRMYGFNLATGSNAVKVSYSSGNPTYITPTAPTADEVTTYGSHIKVPIGDTAKSGAVSITVSSVESLNNVNKNPTFTSNVNDTITAVPYNSQADGTTNNRLTDDVELWVWDMGYFLNTKNITSPMLKMDKNSNYYMSYGNGIQDMTVNVNGTPTRVDYSYNKFHNTNVAFDSNGSIFAVAMNTDRILNDSSRFVLYTPSTANGKVPSATGNRPNPYNYVKSANQTSRRHLELAYNGTRDFYDINRVQFPKLATYYKAGTGNNAGTTYIGIAYYDANNTINPVKLRYGSRSGENISGGIYGQIGDGAQSSSGTVSITMTESNDPTKTDCSAKEYHIIASDNTTFKGGLYTAVGIVPNTITGTTNNVAVVAWYDASARRICYSYNTTPDTEAVGGVWQTNARYLDGTYTGWYVDLAVDDAGGIHIAYYNSAKGDLKYVYLSSYDATPSEPVTVDSYLSVGTDITINVRDEGTANTHKYVPYIYYYNASSNKTCNSIKVAWRNDMTTLRDGAISDKFTGAWESMTIPSENIPIDATVCGGVPTSGTYANSVVLGYMTDVYYEKAYIKK